MRKAALLFFLSVVFIAIAALFWYNELIYSLPTPIPKTYKPVAVGAHINLPLRVSPGKPVFLHFFNPDCPCSRFNISHFRSLVKKYKNDVQFAVVVMTDKTDYTAKKIQDKFHLNIPVMFDTALAASCGVYSTPQAVIMNENQELYYRGNYNKSRYCTDKNTNYAQMALDSLITNKPKPLFNHFALKAYGCVLPTCSK